MNELWKGVEIVKQGRGTDNKGKWKEAVNGKWSKSKGNGKCVGTESIGNRKEYRE